MRTDNYAEKGGSAATGGASYTWHNGLSRDSQTMVVILASCSLAVSLVALFMMQLLLVGHRQNTKDLVEAAEKRVMDRATLAEREARIAQDKYTYLSTELAKQGFKVTTDGH